MLRYPLNRMVGGPLGQYGQVRINSSVHLGSKTQNLEPLAGHVTDNNTAVHHKFTIHSLMHFMFYIVKLSVTQSVERRSIG
jgi:hypothetical protein